MIFYTQSLPRSQQDGPGDASAPPVGPAAAQRQIGAATAAPMVVTGIPFEQPDPHTTQTLRQMALYLEGIRQVSFGR